MKKFNVNATLITTLQVSREIEANNLHDATIKLLENVELKEWIEKTELKTSSK